MAFRAFVRRIPVTLEAVSLRGTIRGTHIKTQPSFLGISAMCAWTDDNGFGYNNKGDLVVVTPQASSGLFRDAGSPDLAILQNSVTSPSTGRVFCLFVSPGTGSRVVVLTLLVTNRLSADGYDYGLLFPTPPPQAEFVLPQPRKVPYTDHDLWTERQSIHPPTDRGNSPWARPIQPSNKGACYSTMASRRSGLAIPSLVIFDKDGTLIDVNNVWIPWLEKFVEDLEKHTGLELEHTLCETVGYCPHKQEYTDGSLLAHATIAEIKESFTEVLVECGIDENEAAEMVDQCDRDFDSGSHDTLEPLGDLATIFETLKQKGIKTAICTADNRRGTMSALEKLGLTNLVDAVVCGDDTHTKPKPDPECALGICRSLNVCPSQTVMIGDTVVDTTLGRNAGLGLTVGVLTGAGSKGLLEREADVVVDSVGDLLATLFPSESGAPAASCV